MRRLEAIGLGQGSAAEVLRAGDQGVGQKIRVESTVAAVGHDRGEPPGHNLAKAFAVGFHTVADDRRHGRRGQQNQLPGVGVGAQHRRHAAHRLCRELRRVTEAVSSRQGCSILYAYEKYGPGKLSPAEEQQYWAACATAAELQTCSPDDIPRTREGVRAYFERMRPRLSASPIARQAMDHLLRTDLVLPPAPRWAVPARAVLARTQRIATIATLPRWMRELAGIRQSRLLDALIVPVMRVSFALAHLSPRLELLLLSQISPSTVPVVAPMKLRIAPRREEVLTPAQARSRHGFPRPAEAHLDLRARQAARILKDGAAPDETALAESEPILGPLE